MSGTTASQPSLSQRLYSLDALRGFDMFWIMGAEDIFHALSKATGSPFWGGVAEQLTHPAWNGFHMYDCIFPLFLFIAGVATPYSVGRELEKGRTREQVLSRVVKRALILVLLGIVANNGLVIRPISEVRFGSVLGRIGLAWMFANLIYIYTAKPFTRIVWFWALILGYYMLLKFTSAPGFNTGDLTQPGNFASYFDRMVMPGKLYLGNHDPEGLLSTIPAISTGLLGIITGGFLKDSRLSGTQKALRMAAFGAIGILGALLWNFDFPINKNLWTSSFVLLVGGISLLFLSLFYYIIDVKGHQKWAFFFKVIGMNSILIYMSGHFIDWGYTNHAFFGWLGQLIGEPYNAVAMAITFVGVEWAFLYFMFKNKVFLRV